jgi:hypothetical protein
MLCFTKHISISLSLSIYIYREREYCENVCNIYELGYGATRSTDGLFATDCFFVFKVQMINPTGRNIFHIQI